MNGVVYTVGIIYDNGEIEFVGFSNDTDYYETVDAYDLDDSFIETKDDYGDDEYDEYGSEIEIQIPKCSTYEEADEYRREAQREFNEKLSVVLMVQDTDGLWYPELD